jgi:PGF-CTERM protein
MDELRTDGSAGEATAETEAPRAPRESPERPATSRRGRSRPHRRTLLRAVATGATALTAAAGASGTAAGQSGSAGEPDATLTLDNVFANAWEVTSVDGEGATADVGAENPEIGLRVGGRYAVRNTAGENHPLAFRDADGRPLLSQSGRGSFESDDAVGWTDEDGTVSFTLTPDLAAAMAEYVCTLHSSMAAPVAVEPREATIGVTAAATPATAAAGEPIAVTVSVERTTSVEPVNAGVDIAVATAEGDPVYSSTASIGEFSGSAVQVTFPADASDGATETGVRTSVTEDGIAIDAETTREYEITVDAYADNAERVSAEASLSVVVDEESAAANGTSGNASVGGNGENASNETSDGDAPAEEEEASGAEGTANDTDRSDGETSEDVPGFGVGSTLAALAGVAYAARRLRSGERE